MSENGTQDRAIPSTASMQILVIRNFGKVHVTDHTSRRSRPRHVSYRKTCRTASGRDLPPEGEATQYGSGRSGLASEGQGSVARTVQTSAARARPPETR